MRSQIDLVFTAETIPLARPIASQSTEAPTTSDSVIGNACAMTEFTDWLW